MGTEPKICRAKSVQSDPREAVQEFFAGVSQADMGLVIFFCSSHYDLDVVAEEFNRLFPGIQLVGCTTAGEIGAGGYSNHSLVGASFNRAAATAISCRMEPLQNFDMSSGHDAAAALWGRLRNEAASASSRNTFALLLIDGLSVREEQVVRAVQSGLGGMSLIGGSAGDDLKFERTWVYHEGAFHSDAAVLLLVHTPLPFLAFKTQHFASEEDRLVVTEADVTHRVVKEINGLPAAEEYARVVGLDVEMLNSDHFASSPVVVVMDGTDYVRSIQRANPDGTLTFYCAIDEGLVLRVARGKDLLGNLEQALENVRKDVGSPQLILGCDCILRNLEITQTGLKEIVGKLLDDNNTVGFSTYGEQYGGVHVNQTFTAIAIGAHHG